jgi:GNAT superfamily N-acetyltransferase
MLESSIIIREYQTRDHQECRALWGELTEWHREIYQDATIGGQHPEDYFDKHLAAVGPNQLWVAVHGLRVVGLVGLIFGADEAEMEPLIVSRAYRGKGIGTRLIERAVAETRKRGVRLLSVRPVARNVETIKLLHKEGFRNVGFIELFIDLSDRVWKPGLEISNCEFNF